MSTTETLPTFSLGVDQAVELNHWFFTTIQPYIKARLLLVGNDLSSFASLLVQHDIPVHLCEPGTDGLTQLRDEYNKNELFRSVQSIDFFKTDFDQVYKSMLGAFSTIIFLHSLDDKFFTKLALKNTGLFLRFRGHIIWAMPSFTASYGGLSLSPQDWKLLDRSPLEKFLCGFQILKTRHFQLHRETNSDFYNHNVLRMVAIARKLA